MAIVRSQMAITPLENGIYANATESRLSPIFCAKMGVGVGGGVIAESGRDWLDFSA